MPPPDCSSPRQTPRHRNWNPGTEASRWPAPLYSTPPGGGRAGSNFTAVTMTDPGAPGGGVVADLTHGVTRQRTDTWTWCGSGHDKPLDVSDLCGLMTEEFHDGGGPGAPCMMYRGAPGQMAPYTGPPELAITMDLHPRCNGAWSTVCTSAPWCRCTKCSGAGV